MRPAAVPRRSAGLALPLLLAACVASRAPLPEPALSPEPGPAEVERVLFLVGDPGEATTATSPVLQRLQRDVEDWAGALDADSAVAVLILGDVLYPNGMNPPGSEQFAHDTAVVMSQVRLVSGPAARARAARAYFLAGNHDWGLREDFEGAVRLGHLQEFLDRVRHATGADVRLVPDAGTGGPWVWDVDPDVRFLLLDTAWWLLGANETTETPFLERVEAAMRSAGGRDVVFVAHHPFRSAGPHGGSVSFWEFLGLYYLLQRGGALLQDLTSRPYRELELGLREIFDRTGPPLAFIGGHEHSLQVIERVEPTDPRYSIVSGSASKLTDVGLRPGLRFGRSAPGYMRLLLEKDGGMHLSVVATPARYLLCGAGAGGGECMAEGVAAFETIHSQRIR